MKYLTFGIIMVWSVSRITQSSSYDLLFPTSPTIIWSPLNPEVIICKGRSSVPQLQGAEKIIGYAPILKKEYLINGYLCTGITLHTRCTKNFFGGITMEYIEQHREVHEHQCLDTIHAQLNGEVVVETYPPEACSWLKTNTDTKSYIRISKSEILYDPYENVGVSEIFPSGKCTSNFCPTMHKGQYWLADQHKKPSCKKDMLEEVIWGIMDRGSGVFDMWSPDINLASGHKVCLMDFCGMSGILFQDQTWIGLNKTLLPKSANIKKYIGSLEYCNKTTHLNILEKEYSVHVAEQSILDKFMEVECFKTKESLILGKPVSRIEIQSLAPRQPGYARVYRLINGTLETGMSHYKFVDFHPPTGNNPLIIIDSQNNNVHWHYWVEDKIRDILDGPNGLFIHGRRIYFQNMNIDEYRRALSLSLKQVIQISSPSYHSLPGVISDSEQVMYSKVDDKSMSDVQPFHMPKWISFLIYTGFGLALLIGVSIIYKFSNLFSRCFKGRAPVRSNQVVYYKP